MKKSKQLAGILLAVLLLMSVAVCFGIYKNAQLQTSHGSRPFFVQSLSCPADIMEYASKNAMGLVRTMDETHSLDYDTIKVGQPFTYGDRVPLFTFPVYSGDKIVYTFRVTYAPDGSVNSTASTFLVDELNSYRNRTSQDRPLLFDIIDQSLCVCFGNETTKICTFSVGDSPNTTHSDSNHIDWNLNVLDIAEPIELQDGR